MKTLLIALALFAGVLVSAIVADNPRYECKNGKCTLLPRPRLEATPTPADPATKPAVESAPVVMAEVNCSGAKTAESKSDCGGSRTVRTPVRNVVSNAAKVRPLRTLKSVLFRGCSGS